MAFCSNCGNQMDGSERFCVKCGKEQSGAQSAGPSVQPPAATPMPHPAAIPVQPMAPPPGVFMPPPGAIPVMAMPQEKKGGKWGTIVVVLLVLGGGYYYYTHKPGPTDQHQKGQGEALAKQQDFDAHWDAVNGYIQISNGKWTNNSTTPIQSATLECDQLDANGTDLNEMRTTLNGPLQPGTSDSFNAFQMGAAANNLNKVTCTIVRAKAVGEQ